MSLTVMHEQSFELNTIRVLFCFARIIISVYLRALVNESLCSGAVVVQL